MVTIEGLEAAYQELAKSRVLLVFGLDVEAKLKAALETARAQTIMGGLAGKNEQQREAELHLALLKEIEQVNEAAEEVRNWRLQADEAALHVEHMRQELKLRAVLMEEEAWAWGGQHE